MTPYSNSSTDQPLKWHESIIFRQILGLSVIIYIVSELLKCIFRDAFGKKPQDGPEPGHREAVVETRRAAVGIREAVKKDRKLLTKANFHERSLPNQEFGHTVGIENAFTTHDKSWHKEFVTSTRKLIRFSPE
ncbi:hypothetical protein L207DRAFT_578512 [Hyaloscypha variabilis F]|uniref:Uncharacterized protein n=1 Tax=Hyaloscypha variabilis (strain UAMH 11265 / GT02V1 / F) TaxID=1149755 RepID=A0A2J6S4B7_HYAVF|nr:hypothetical protein L207DRAFT_578512 [Hyaloscypha variabilis F]